MCVVFSSTEDIIEFCSEKALRGVLNLKSSGKSFRLFLFELLAHSWVSVHISVKVPCIKRILSTYNQSVVKAQLSHLVWDQTSPTWARQSKSSCVVKFSVLPDDNYLLFVLWQRCWLGHRAGWTVWCHCSLPPQWALQKGRPQSGMGLNPLHFWHTQKESWSPGWGMKYK